MVITFWISAVVEYAPSFMRVRVPVSAVMHATPCRVTLADALAPPSGHFDAIPKKSIFKSLNGNFNFEMVIPIFDKT